MDADRWNEIRARFDELLELESEGRAQRLARLGAADPELRDAVAMLLAADARSSGVLGAPAPAPSPKRADPFGLSGRTISHFRVLEPLGAGGMGVVYRAEDIRLGRRVALKLPLPQLQLDAVHKERFLREARSAAVLDHPNLCVIHEVGESEDGRLFLAMPLYAGETLRSRLDREGKLPISDAAAIARQVAQGLACAHAAGIVHRDLKPSNLMVLPDGTVKILDFGLAKARETGLTGSGLTPGTVAYMAPEQVRGEAVDPRADLWALGVVLYEMLTGRRPFAGEPEIAVARAITEDTPASPAALRAEVPAALDDAVLRLLAKDPGERPGSAAEVAEALGAKHSVEVVPSRRPPWTRPGARRRRQPVRAVAYFAGVFILVGAVWGVVVLRRHYGADLDPHRVVVAVFQNETGDTNYNSLGHFAADYITQGLAGSDFATPIDARGMPGAWRDSASDPTVARRLAIENGAGTLVRGRYYLVGDSIRLDAEITDARDGHLLRDVEPVATSRTSVESGVERLREQVLGAMAAVLTPWLTSWESRSKDPVPSYAAYRAYSTGLEAYTAGEFLPAAAAFDMAAALDTTFLAPGIWAALSHYLGAETADLTRAGQASQVAQADSIATEIERRRNRLRPYDRHFFDWYLGYRHDDADAQYRATQRMVESAPTSVNAQKELALSAYRDNRPREAWRVMERLNPQRLAAPGAGINYWGCSVMCAHESQDYALELRNARLAERVHPGVPFFVAHELEALTALGRVGEAERLLERKPDALPPDLIYLVGLEMRVHGEPEASRRTLLRALAAARAQPTIGPGERTATRLEADILFALRREAEARPLYEQLVRADSLGWWARGRLGVIAAHARDLVTARRVFAGLLADTFVVSQRSGDLFGARAILAAALPARDVAVLYAGNASWLDLHRLPDFDPLRGYPPFETLLRPKD